MNIDLGFPVTPVPRTTLVYRPSQLDLLAHVAVASAECTGRTLLIFHTSADSTIDLRPWIGKLHMVVFLDGVNVLPASVSANLETPNKLWLVKCVYRFKL